MAKKVYGYFVPGQGVQWSGTDYQEAFESARRVNRNRPQVMVLVSGRPLPDGKFQWRPACLSDTNLT